MFVDRKPKRYTEVMWDRSGLRAEEPSSDMDLSSFTGERQDDPNHYGSEIRYAAGPPLLRGPGSVRHVSPSLTAAEYISAGDASSFLSEPQSGQQMHANPAKAGDLNSDGYGAGHKVYSFTAEPNLAVDFSDTRSPASETYYLPGPGQGRGGSSRMHDASENPSSDDEDFGKFCRRVASRMGLGEVQAPAGALGTVNAGHGSARGPNEPAMSLSGRSWAGSSPVAPTIKLPSAGSDEEPHASVDVRVMLTSAEEHDNRSPPPPYLSDLPSGPSAANGLEAGAPSAALACSEPSSAPPVPVDAPADTSGHGSALDSHPTAFFSKVPLDPGDWDRPKASAGMGLSIETESSASRSPGDGRRSRELVSFSSSLYNLGESTMHSAPAASPNLLPSRQEMGWQSNQLFVSADGDAEQQSGHDTSFTGGLWDQPLPTMVDPEVFQREAPTSSGPSGSADKGSDPPGPRFSVDVTKIGAPWARAGSASGPHVPRDLSDLVRGPPTRAVESATQGQDAMDGITEEERALEAELDDIDRALLARVSPGMAKRIVSQASPPPSSASEGGGGLGGSRSKDNSPWGTSPLFSATVMPQLVAWPSKSMDKTSSSGPTEYIAGQERNPDLYVPAGALSPGPATPRGPFGDLFSALGQHQPLEAALAQAPELEALNHLGISNAWQGGGSPSESAAQEPPAVQVPGPYEWQGGRPRPSRKGREDLDMRVADRLYSSAVETRARREARRVAAHQEREEAEMEECTFKPAISPRSARMVASRSRSKSPGPAEQGPRSSPSRSASPSPPKPASSRGPQDTASRGSWQADSRRQRTGQGPFVIQSSAWEWDPIDAGRLAGGGDPSVRGFDPSMRKTTHYEAELSASVARAAQAAPRAAPSPLTATELLGARSSTVGAEYGFGRLSEFAGFDEGIGIEKVVEAALPKQRKPNEPVVTQACHRLYDQALKSKEKLQAKRRQAREQEQRLSQTTVQILRSRSVSPQMARPEWHGPEDSPYLPLRASRRPLSAPRRKPEADRSPSPGRAKSYNPDDFKEFLHRQKKFLAKREDKITSAIQAQARRKPHLVSEGSKNILKRQEDAARLVEDELMALGYMKANEYCSRRLAKGSYMADTVSSNYKSVPPQHIQSSTASFVHRMEAAMQSPYARGAQRSPSQSPSKSKAGASSAGKQRSAVLDPECTFKPEITKKAAKKPARSCADMSQGDWERKQAWRHEKQKQKQAQELQGATFRPAVNTSRPAKSKLGLKDPEIYMEFVEQRSRQRELLVARQQAKRAEEELAGCTFAPRVSSAPPKFIERFARTHAARAAAGMGRQPAPHPRRQWR